MQLNYHPAPGLGDLIPGFYVVPQNPIEKTRYIPRIGDILPAKYAVPQNPVTDYMNGRLNLIGRDPNVTGTVNGVSGCGCGGSCGSCGGGMGDISSDLSNVGTMISSGDVMGALKAPVFGVPVWAVVGGLLAATYMMSGKGGYRRR